MYRILGIFISVLLYWCEMESLFLEHLEYILDSDSAHFLANFRLFQICFKGWEAVLSLIVGLVMGAFFNLIVISNVTVINFFNEMPTSLAIVQIFLSVTLLFVLDFSLPVMGSCYDKTGNLLRAKKKQLEAGQPGFSRKFELKVLKSIRPIPIRCGGFFDLRRDSLSQYFNGIVQRTVDSVLLTRGY